MIPLLWVLQSLQTSVIASASIEWYPGLGKHVDASLTTKGLFLPGFQGEASGLVHEVGSKRYYNFSNRINSWIGVIPCPNVPYKRSSSSKLFANAIRNSVHFGASALIFLCFNFEPELVDEIQHEAMHSASCPIVSVSTMENISSILKFFERNLIVRARIKNRDVQEKVQNRIATVSVWTACSRTRHPLSTRLDGVFCAGTSSTKETVVAVWNASSVAVLSVFFAVLLRLKQFLTASRLFRMNGGLEMSRNYKIVGCNGLMIDRFLPTRIADSHDFGNVCPICLDVFETHQKLRSLPCNHYFHASCIDEWLVIVPCCPLCKRSALPEEN